MSSLKNIDPGRAANLVRQGAVLVDVREAHEHAAEHIPGACHCALSTIDPRQPIAPGATVLIFHCKSGGRTNLNAGRLAAVAGTREAYLLGGGIEAWRRAGLPTTAAANSGPAGEGGIIRRFAKLFG